jgi:hypothetical protein
MMGCTVREIQDRMGSDEFTEWIAFHNLDPWSRSRDDLGHAITATVVANAHTSKGKGFKVADFMPDFSKRARRAQSQQATRMLMLAYCRASGGSVING